MRIHPTYGCVSNKLLALQALCNNSAFFILFQEAKPMCMIWSSATAASTLTTSRWRVRIIGLTQIHYSKYQQHNNDRNSLNPSRNE